MKYTKSASIFLVCTCAAMMTSASAIAKPPAQVPAAGASTATQGEATRAVLNATSQVLTTLQQRRAQFQANPAELRSYVDSQLDHLFDKTYAARLVLGVHARSASPEDVSKFADALANSLMQRYGSALLNFDGKPSFRARSETPLPNNLGVRVSTELLRAGSDPTPVDYFVHKVDGTWKVFDVMIEGISYVQTFRDQFDTPLRQQGLKKVIADLQSGKPIGGGANTGN